MGRILRKRRGNEDTENPVAAKLNPQGIKNSSVHTVIKDHKSLVSAGSPLITEKRKVLMDKTNALKQKVKQTGTKAPNLKASTTSSQKSKEVGEKLGKIARRRRSSKENDEQLRKYPGDETKSTPLGDKTNASESTKRLLKGTVYIGNEEVKSAASDVRDPASPKESTRHDDGNACNSFSLESSEKKRPPRNAAKFKAGWISALRSSRLSYDYDALLQEPPQSKTKPKTVVSPQTRETHPLEQTKRTRQGVDAKPDGGLNAAKVDCKRSLLRSSGSAAKHDVPRDSHSKLEKCRTLSSESDDIGQASEDEEATKVQPTESNKSPLLRRPRRNAAKYEKGRFSSLGRPRKSDENGGRAQKSPSKIESSFSDEKAVESGNEDAASGHTSRFTKTAEGKLESKRDLDLPSKSGAVDAESKPRGLKNFESRIAAKLGMDINDQTSGTKSKDKSPKKPCQETSSRRLRKHVVDEKKKTYAEAEGSNDELPKKIPSKQGPKALQKSPILALAVPQKDKKHALEDINASLSCTGVHDAAPSAEIGLEDEDSASAIISKMGVGCKNESNLAKSNSPNVIEHDPKPGCSWDSGSTTPLRRSGTSKPSDGVKKSPLVSPSSSLFSIFKKPVIPRRNSMENKIFVSGAKPCLSETSNKKVLPIYGDPNMTPLKKASNLPQEKKQELYDFEVDENEPKPKKKHKPIMKIQRVRAVKRKKPKVYEADPETERRVLRNLDLSPSVLEEFRSAKKKKVENAEGVVAAHPSVSVHRAEAAEILGSHSPDGRDPDDHNFDFDSGPMSSPCRDYGQSTPMRTDAPSMLMDQDKMGRLSAKAYSPVKSSDSPIRNDAPNMFLVDSRYKFGGPSAKEYSPLVSKDSPIPVLMAEYNNDPVRAGDSSRQSAVSNVSCSSAVSGNSIYRNDLDVSASTPVKFNKNSSTIYSRQRPKPLELNISNCFGFDEPDIMEEPLVSPIKSTIHVPDNAVPGTTVVRPAPMLKSKLPVMLPPTESQAVDVEQVIKQLRFEVGDDSSANNSANVSVFDDSEITLKNKSPIKRYLLPKDAHKHKATRAADESTTDEGNDSLSPVPVALKLPRVSYERPSKLRKKAIQPVYKEPSDEVAAADSEESDVEHEPAHPEEMFKPTRNKIATNKDVPKKKEKGMTKKEEEELEKWAQMFNSQCDQIDGFGLVVE